MNKILNAIDERIKIKEIYEKYLAGYMVPENLNIWYSMGSVLVIIFSIQVITGILLLVYYVPSVEQAFKSVVYITNEVPFGWLIRRVHAIAANLFVLVLLFHMVSVVIMGSYKKPREIHWFTGCILLALVLIACLSGYLLPWSQLSYWATTIATNFPGAFPVIGDFLVRLIRGGEKVTQHTLGRFFAMHVSFIPFFIFILIMVHIFVMRRTGISYPPGTDEKKVRKIPFFPHFFMEDLKVIYFFMAVLFLFVFFFPQISFPKDSLIPADPLSTPEHIKPEWYFLANYQILRLIPNKFLGIFLQIIMIFIILFLPFIDRSSERRIWKRPIFAIIVFLSIIGYIALAIWGYIE